jgi:hypothetical protein
MADVKKAPFKEYELLKPLRQGGKLIEPAEEGQPVIKVKLRRDQAERLSDSGHIKMAA